jgi:hypothetical protein
MKSGTSDAYLSKDLALNTRAMKQVTASQSGKPRIRYKEHLHDGLLIQSRYRSCKKLINGIPVIERVFSPVILLCSLLRAARLPGTDNFGVWVQKRAQLPLLVSESDLFDHRSTTCLSRQA